MISYAVILNAMGNLKRLQVLAELRKGECSVNVLAERVSLSQSALSQHLAKLRSAKLVSNRRESQTIYYSVSSPAVFAILEALERTADAGPAAKRERASKQ